MEPLTATPHPIPLLAAWQRCVATSSLRGVSPEGAPIYSRSCEHLGAFSCPDDPDRDEMIPMSEEEAALLRIRVLRRDEYRCRWRHREGSPMCGEHAPNIGTTLHSDAIVALCIRHHLER